MPKDNLKKLKIQNVIIDHVKMNLREYIIVFLIFVIGIFLGVMFVNNIKDDQKQEIKDYMQTYISSVKENPNISNQENLQQEIIQTVILVFVLWFAGTTVIGIPVVLGLILFRGFAIGYTISACVYSIGLPNGIFFMLTTVFLQNIIFIPVLIALGVSAIKLYKSILKDKTKSNIKLEIIRHTMFSGIMLIFMIISAIIKINVSGNMLESLIKYF